MRTAYFDCFAGASGDMVVGALIDLGLDPTQLKEELDKLRLPGWRMHVRTVDKNGVRATKVDVLIEQGVGGEVIADAEFREVDLRTKAKFQDHDHTHDQGHDHHHSHEGGHGHAHEEHRPLRVILQLLEQSDLNPLDKARAVRIFMRLGAAESKVHGVPVEDIHFHEVGGVDAIVDIVSACIGIRLLGIENIVVSPIHVGSGFVQMAHGLYPIPGPATANLLVGAPVYATEVKGELVTPTGAAILTTLADGFGPMPAMIMRATGYGAGARDREIPNVLRVMIGEEEGVSGQYRKESAIMVEANIDDMNPEIYDYVMERLYQVGVMDVLWSPAQMKKNRPAQILQVMVAPEGLGQVLSILFNETTTIGARTYEVVKYILPRESITVPTVYGSVRVKVARDHSGIVNIAPEYEDCKAVARTHGVPLKVLYQAAHQAALNLTSLTVAEEI